MGIPTVESLAGQAEKAYRSGKYHEAAGLFEQAAANAREDGDLLRVAELNNNRSVALLRAGSAQQALEAALGTDQVFALAGDLKRQALALGNLAAALDALNRPAEALKCYRKSSDLLKQVDDQENRAYVLKQISALQLRTGHQLEALASMDAALEHKKQLSFRERVLKKIIDVPFKMLRRGG
jgi:tetratricopeptide (TPR) repeat protein